MLKLIIVDDEKVIRDNVAGIVDWNRFGFTLAASCENGLEALESAQQIIPDLVITDIRMPFMDGIELARELRQRFGASVKIVFLTGFDEFEYAQKAINLKAENYILKPVSAAMLQDMLVAVKDQIDEEIRVKRDLQRLSQYYESSLPLLRNSFLNELIAQTPPSSMTEASWTRRIANLGLDALAGRHFLVAVMRIDPESYHSPEYADDRDLYNYAVFNIAEEVLHEDKTATVFPNGHETVVILASADPLGQAGVGWFDARLEIVRLSAAKFLPFTISLGVSDSVEGIAHVRQAYESATAALQYRMLLGGNRLIHIGDFETGGRASHSLARADEEQLVSALKTGQTSAIHTLVDQAFGQAMSPHSPEHASPRQLKNLILSLYLAIQREADAAGLDTAILGSGAGWTPEALERLLHERGIQAVRERVLEAALRVADAIQAQRIDSGRLLALKARDYIDRTYASPDLSVSQVCSHLNISASYFSALFKKEFNDHFAAYLLKVRMTRARELILANRERKSYEIAAQVGYPDPHYFSYSFKKFFGISPSEMKRA